MVVGSSVSKLHNFSMMDSLDIPFESLSILSPSTKLAAEEALPVEAGDSEEDTESFNEEDCLFVDTGNEEDGGAFSHYSKASARPTSSARPRPHSACRDDDEDEVHEGAFSHYSRASAWPNSARPQPNSANRGSEEDEAYEGAFSHYCRASSKLNSGRPRPNSARSIFAYHEKEKEIPCDINIGRKFDDRHDTRLQTDIGPGCEPFASYDDRSLPFDIAPASPNTAAMRRSRRAKKNTLSVRESLLAEAWERKRELMLNEELANFKEHAKPELLGRSASDCGKIISNVQGPSELRRSRTRSLTDDDFEELRGCIDLGFRFDQSSIPDLCDTLPALEVYCAVAQNFQESPNCLSPVTQSPARCSSPSTASSWKISSPGDNPQDVKGRLRHWAQAVACNAKLCY